MATAPIGFAPAVYGAPDRGSYLPPSAYEWLLQKFGGDTALQIDSLAEALGPTTINGFPQPPLSPSVRQATLMNLRLLYQGSTPEQAQAQSDAWLNQVHCAFPQSGGGCGSAAPASSDGTVGAAAAGAGAVQPASSSVTNGIASLASSLNIPTWLIWVGLALLLWMSFRKF